MSLGLGAAGLGYAAICLVWFDGGLWSAGLWWSGALPSLAAAPVFILAWLDWRRHRMQRAATLLFIGLFAFTILANWPRGTFSPAWYLHPVLALLATTCLGVIGGLLLTLAAVSTLLLGTWMNAGAVTGTSQLPEAWMHAASLSAVTLASALAGAISNRLVFLTLRAAEAQRRKNFDAGRALRHRERLLRHALRVETVGDIAGMVCHQLRNTFQVLHGHVTLARMGGTDDREDRLHKIEQTLEHATPLLQQLMHMAHPDEGTTVSCGLSTVLREFHEQASLVLPSSIRITCEVPSHVPDVLLNPHGLVHALWNLVINAKQAIEGEGTIALRCGSDAHQVWIEVSDTGAGIPQDARERIFDPYFTTKPAGQGTGLGLAAVLRFVRSSSGIVQVDSQTGRGTTFRLRFPQAAERRRVAEDTRSAAGEAS